LTIFQYTSLVNPYALNRTLRINDKSPNFVDGHSANSMYLYNVWLNIYTTGI